MSDDSYHEKNYNDIYTNIVDISNDNHGTFETSQVGLPGVIRVDKMIHMDKKHVDIQTKTLEAKRELSDKREYKKSTTNRRADFEYLELDKVNFMKSMMLIIYILVVVGLAYTLFLSTDVDKRTKGIILAFFTLYPILFIPIILYFYNTLVYIVSLMTGNIYKKTDF